MPDRTPKIQAGQNGSRRLRGLFFLLLLLLPPGLALTACGKKASELDPPLGSKEEDFPRVYPDTATDPKP